MAGADVRGKIGAEGPRQKESARHEHLARQRPCARVHRTGGSGPLGGDAGRTAPPARQHRAHRQRELRVRGGHGSPGLVAHQQVRRGPAGQALLRRLRVRRRRRAARPGPRARPLPGRRARQRPAAQRRPGQHGRLLQRPPARRPDHGHEPGPWRPPHPRHGPQLLGPAVRGPRLRRSPGHGTDRLRRDGGPGEGDPPEADRRRGLGVSADLGVRADGRHRPRRRRAAVRRHGPRRGARRGRCPPEPVPARRPRHDDDPQDPARAARRPRVQSDGPAGRGGRRRLPGGQGIAGGVRRPQRLPGHPGRPAHARHRGQGRGVQAGRRGDVPRGPAPDDRQRPGAGGRPHQPGRSGRLGRHGQPPAAGRRDPARA